MLFFAMLKHKKGQHFLVHSKSIMPNLFTKDIAYLVLVIYASLKFLEFTSSVKIRCSMFNVHNIVLNKKGGMFYVHILLLYVNYFSFTKTLFINFDGFELAIIKFSIKIIYKFRFIIMIVPRINYVIQEKYVLHIHMNRNIFKFIQSYE